MFRTVSTLLAVVIATTAHANLIRNASFEDVPDDTIGQGILPSEWTVVRSSPDTYSNDGSYGITPGDFGNFPEVTAFDGNRWIAGWSLADEQFGQTLTDPLTAGSTYTFSAQMIQARRNDLNNPGGYELYLTSDASGDLDSGVLLGSVGVTSAASDWALYALTFTAPVNADQLPFLLFKPFGSVGGEAYPGIDAVQLTAVPLPAALWLLGSTLLGLRWLGPTS